MTHSEASDWAKRWTACGIFNGVWTGRPIIELVKAGKSEEEPLHSLLDSAARHLAKYIAGQADEDHLRAACWNLLWALEQRTTHPDLNDMPWAK